MIETDSTPIRNVSKSSQPKTILAANTEDVTTESRRKYRRNFARSGSRWISCASASTTIAFVTAKKLKVWFSQSTLLPRRQIQTALDRARDQGLQIKQLARVSLVQRAEIPRPFLDLNDAERKSGPEELPVQEQASGAPVPIEERVQRFKAEVGFRRHDQPSRASLEQSEAQKHFCASDGVRRCSVRAATRIQRTRVLKV